MAPSDAIPVPRKNVACRVYFPIFDGSGDLISGAAGLDSEISKDGIGFIDCTAEAVEIGVSGTYYLDLTATEMNCDGAVILVKTSTPGAKTTPIILYPEQAGDIRVVTSGGGSVEFIYTVTNSITTLPIEGVTVWVTTDLPGANIIASGHTDAFGRVTFFLDPGTYYFWRSMSGYSFTNPDTEVIV